MKKQKNLQIIQYYSCLSIEAKAGMWFLFCNFFQKGIIALTTPIYTRMLSPSDYGYLSIYYSWQDIGMIFIILGLTSSVYTRGLIKYSNDMDSYSKSMFILVLMISLGAMTIAAIFHEEICSLTGLRYYELNCIVFFSLFSAIIDLYIQKERVQYKYRIFVFITLMLVILKPSIGISTMLIFPNSRIQSRIFSEVFVVFGVAIGTGFLLLNNNARCIKPVIWKESILFVIPLIPHYLAQRVLSFSDRIMISRYIGNKEAGIYSLAYSIGMLALIFNSALDNTVSPWVYNKIKNQEYEDIQNVSKKMIIGVLLCSCGIMLVVPEIVNVFATKQYSAAQDIVPMIICSSFFIFLYTQFIYFEYYTGKTKYIALFTILSAGLNVILNWGLIPQFGYKVAAFTTMFCYFIYSIGHLITMNYQCRKYLNIEGLYSFSWVVCISLGIMSVSYFTPKIYEYSFLRIILIIVWCFVFLQYLKINIRDAIIMIKE